MKSAIERLLVATFVLAVLYFGASIVSSMEGCVGEWVNRRRPFWDHRERKQSQREERRAQPFTPFRDRKPQTEPTPMPPRPTPPRPDNRRRRRFTPFR